MINPIAATVHKLSQQYAYTALQMHEAIARHAGLSGTDQKYLGFFITKGTMTAGELAVLTGLTTGAVTGLIDRFEKKKLVKRQFDKTDRRKVMIVPDTAKIKMLLEPLYKEFSTESGKVIASFSDKEKKIIATYLERSIAVMMNTTAGIGSKQIVKQ